MEWMVVLGSKIMARLYARVFSLCTTVYAVFPLHWARSRKQESITHLRAHTHTHRTLKYIVRYRLRTAVSCAPTALCHGTVPHAPRPSVSGRSLT